MQTWGDLLSLKLQWEAKAGVKTLKPPTTHHENYLIHGPLGLHCET